MSYILDSMFVLTSWFFLYMAYCQLKDLKSNEFWPLLSRSILCSSFVISLLLVPWFIIEDYDQTFHHQSVESIILTYIGVFILFEFLFVTFFVVSKESKT
ncbi:hypothetical protein Pan241w_37090 [Gimesia alba]|uniref:Uncharacterized protein n=1 Tax=Gimesia alba TaxID=2527973 RepID=A0A517RI93_9PLAN|nr:hypothetical protein Pan241w_37090 [Gimesia alba]